MSHSVIPISSSSPTRALAQRSMLASLAVLLASGMLPLEAQQVRAEITRTRAPRSAAADSNERQLRRYKWQLDSLTRLYNDHDDLTLAERRVVEDELARTVRQLEQILARMDSDDPMTVVGEQHLRIQMAPQAAERASQSMSRALMQVREDELAKPRGWIGFVASGPNITRVEDGEMLVRYFSYPRVVSVDPSSPAQRAGIVPSDTLLAYNGDDVTEGDISLTRLLTPNARVLVRIRRDGRTRDVPVTVATVPSRIKQRRDDELRTSEKWVIATVPQAPGFPRMPSLASSAPQQLRVSTRTPMAALAPMPPMPPASLGDGGFTIAFGSGVAGAQLTTINEGLGQLLGVSAGVLVTSAPVGSPANESGLKDGDIILKVGSQAVRRVSDVMELVGLAAENGDHAIDLQILRKRKPIRLTLRWRN